MTEKIDFGKTAGRLCVEDCCPCCGGPCYDGCDLCEDKERAAREGEPSCCTGRCCTCFPGLNLEGMEKGEPGVPENRDLEASFFLENCSNADCNGYLGSILLRGSRKAIPEDATGMLPAGCDFDDIDEGERALDALCIRKTDAGGTFIPTNNSQDCTKQICGQKSREGLPEGAGGVPIYEIWSGFGLICKDGEKAEGDSPITKSCEWDKGDNLPDCGGEMVELSVCCCQGNNKNEENSKGDCHHQLYTCTQAKEEIKAGTVDIDQVCSCMCYTVEFKNHNINFPCTPAGPGVQKCYGSFSPSEDCYNEQKPACPTESACKLDIIDCRCMDVNEGAEKTPPQPQCNDGWYICAELESGQPWSCNCCPGVTTGGGGGPGGGTRQACQGGWKLKVFIVPKEESTARENGRVGEDNCPSC